MRVTISWLKEFVDITQSPAQLAEALTMVGLEVESVEEIKHDFTNVVIGKIVECKPHPSAEKLQLCQVETGGRRYSVVCGAPNVAVGMLAPLALPNATLQGQVVELREIRGVNSEGVLCSEAELGLTERAEGLMVLPVDAPVGAELKNFLGETDYILDVAVTANRPDCLSVLGIAREIAAITGQQLKKPKIHVSKSGEAVEKYISVQIKDKAHCYRYSGRFLTEVQIKDSPFWMAYRLHHAGMRAINNVVDITNYVMLLLGHPLHAFDYRQIEGKKIIVRAATPNEKFITLDGKEHVLDGEMCLICDSNKPVALAGIMGGLNSEVQQDTQTVFLESAYFEPSNIRRTAKRLQISTESSRRFERGADPNGTLPALHLASQLMVQLANAKIVGNAIDVISRPIKPTKISFSLHRCNALLGSNIGKKEVHRILKALEIDARFDDADKAELQIPTFRPDLTREVDIIEEIARLHGYDNIPFDFTATIDQTQPANERIHFCDQLRTILAGMGLNETLSLSLVSRESAELFLPENAKAIELLNPLSADWAFFRTSILISLLNNVAYNRNRQMHNLRFFELGNTAWYDGTNGAVVEKKQIAGLICGKANEGVWYAKPQDCDFYDIKGIVLGLLHKLGINSYRFINAPEKVWDKESTGIILGEKDYLGSFGKVNKSVISHFKIKIADVYAFALDFEVLYRHRKLEKIFNPIPRFPFVPFDLALVVDADVPVGEIEKEIEKAAGPYFQGAQLFDYYKGEQVPAGKKSVAFSLTFISKERTLQEEDINAAIDDILKHLKARFGAELRQR